MTLKTRSAVVVVVLSCLWLAMTACSSSPPSGEEANAENPEQSAAAETDAAPTTDLSAAPDAPAADGSTGAPETLEGAPADSTTAAGEATDSASSPETASTESASAAPKQPWTGKSVAQDIRREPFQAEDGRWLNAYYFVRAGEESWEAVSQKIYGNAEAAAQLQAWNPSVKLSPGNAVYYMSMTRPSDNTAMKVHAEDYGATLDQVTVGPGESLSRIAQKLYGSAKSWQELAALNPELGNPDRIMPGTAIRTQPAQVDVAAAANLAREEALRKQQEEQLAQQKAQQEQQLQQERQRQQQELAARQNQAQEPSETRAPASRPEVAQEEAGGIMGRIKDNPIAAAIFGIGVLGGLAFAGIRIRSRMSAG